ncbi:hypothetical protein O9X98_05915 [Agrobacterium salinitolerans]|nr:hypothetical protein [Agrobacterium salinitolerans]
MTPIELQRAVSELFPENGKGTFADALRVDYTTTWRYSQRELVPGPVAAAVSAWMLLSREYDIAPPSKPCETRDFDEMVELASPGTRKQSGLSGIEAAAFLVFGDGWKRSLSLCLGIDASTLWRQIVHDNVSGPVAAAVRGWLLIWRLTGEAPQLPQKPTSKSPKKKMPAYARLLLD